MHRQSSLRDRCAPVVRACALSTILLAAAAVPTAVHAQSLNTYHIGNSLTWDSRPDYGLTKLATDAGLSLTTGFHIRCSQSLDYILNNPVETCVTPNTFGYYGAAFADHTWDAVTLQPFSNPADPSSPRMEAAAMKSLIQLARQNPGNTDTTFYLYTGWMTRTEAGTDFYSAWYDPSPVDPDAGLIRNNASFDWIYNTLASDPDLAGVDLQIIPVGDVLAELDRRITLGEITGFPGAEALYRDDLHMNNLGWFAASNTVLSTLFKIDPTGTPTNSAYAIAPGQAVPIEITPELGALVQDAVWDVVLNHPHTGFIDGDLNGDGFVGIADLNIVLGQWNHNVAAGDQQQGDPSGDGFVGIADLNTVLGNWNVGPPPPTSFAAVPEPGVAMLLLSLLVMRTHRPQADRANDRAQDELHNTP